MTNLEQAGMIIHALKNLLRERQVVHGRGGYPTDSDWLTIDRAIAATGFEINAPAARAGSEGWQSTLESALRRSANAEPSCARCGRGVRPQCGQPAA